MSKFLLIVCAALTLITSSALSLLSRNTEAATLKSSIGAPADADGPFEVDVLVDGRQLEEYYSRGRTYVEARANVEYEVRIRNPYPYRVAVAVSVDGLNSIDARRTSAWNASKWVIEPYQTIQVKGWQMSSERARRFYFTTERESYAARLGQTSNLGIISVVFFRERRSIPIPITPPPHPRPYEENERGERKSQAPSTGAQAQSRAKDGRDSIVAPPDEDYAATGIGRSVENQVRWVNMDLESRPAAEVSIRYEYYPALVRLGILPRPYPQTDPIRRRESATGFEDRRFSPEP